MSQSPPRKSKRSSNVRDRIIESVSAARVIDRSQEVPGGVRLRPGMLSNRPVLPDA